jgi:hypothetical protein
MGIFFQTASPQQEFDDFMNKIISLLEDIKKLLEEKQ